MPGVSGCRILIVEDEFLLASDLSRYFKNMGAVVLGPVPDIDSARSQIRFADIAVLDIDLNGEKVFPVAEELQGRGIPFVFFSGKDDIAIPSQFRFVGHLRKPIPLRAVYEALFPVNGERDDRPEAAPDDVASALPKLRLTARLLMGDNGTADRLVEVTLQRAINEIGSRQTEVSNEIWLSQLLEDTFRRSGRDMML